jgi:hypothetical protein
MRRDYEKRENARKAAAHTPSPLSYAERRTQEEFAEIQEQERELQAQRKSAQLTAERAAALAEEEAYEEEKINRSRRIDAAHEAAEKRAAKLRAATAADCTAYTAALQDAVDRGDIDSAAAIKERISSRIMAPVGFETWEAYWDDNPIIPRSPQYGEERVLDAPVRTPSHSTPPPPNVAFDKIRRPVFTYHESCQAHRDLLVEAYRKYGHKTGEGPPYVPTIPTSCNRFVAAQELKTPLAARRQAAAINNYLSRLYRDAAHQLTSYERGLEQGAAEFIREQKRLASPDAATQPAAAAWHRARSRITDLQKRGQPASILKEMQATVAEEARAQAEADGASGAADPAAAPAAARSLSFTSDQPPPPPASASPAQQPDDGRQGGSPRVAISLPDQAAARDAAASAARAATVAAAPGHASQVAADSASSDDDDAASSTLAPRAQPRRAKTARAPSPPREQPPPAPRSVP